MATKCEGGLVYEPCHFCQTCAKVIGDTCGGNHSEYGKCDEYLECLNGTEVMDGSNGIGTCYPIGMQYYTTMQIPVHVVQAPTLQ